MGSGVVMEVQIPAAPGCHAMPNRAEPSQHVCVRAGAYTYVVTHIHHQLEHTTAATEVFVRKKEGNTERKKERESAAVADSIRHAGLQCKLLHGHRCGFYGRNTGLF